MESIASRSGRRNIQIDSSLSDVLSRFNIAYPKLAASVSVQAQTKTLSTLYEYLNYLKRQQEKNMIVDKVKVALEKAQTTEPEKRKQILLQLMDDLEASRAKAGVFCATFYPDEGYVERENRVIMLPAVQVEGSLILEPFPNPEQKKPVDVSRQITIPTTNDVFYLLTRKGITAYTVTQIPAEQLERSDLEQHKLNLQRLNADGVRIVQQTKGALTKAVSVGGVIVDGIDRMLCSSYLYPFCKAATVSESNDDVVISPDGKVNIEGYYSDRNIATSFEQLCQVADQSPHLITALNESLS